VPSQNDFERSGGTWVLKISANMTELEELVMEEMGGHFWGREAINRKAKWGGDRWVSEHPIQSDGIMRKKGGVTIFLKIQKSMGSKGGEKVSKGTALKEVIKDHQKKTKPARDQVTRGKMEKVVLDHKAGGVRSSEKKEPGTEIYCAKNVQKKIPCRSRLRLPKRIAGRVFLDNGGNQARNKFRGGNTSGTGGVGRSGGIKAR